MDTTGGFAGYGHPTNERIALLEDGRLAVLRFALDHEGENRYVENLTSVKEFVASVAESGPALTGATFHTVWTLALDPEAAAENRTLLDGFAEAAGDRHPDPESSCYDCSTFTFYHRDPPHEHTMYGSYLDFEEPWASWSQWAPDRSWTARTTGECWGDC